MAEIEALNLLLRNATEGKFLRACVAALVQLFGTLAPGREVLLGDGRRAVVRGVGEPEPLAALVETEGGEILDLSDPAMPPIAEFRDALPC